MGATANLKARVTEANVDAFVRHAVVGLFRLIYYEACLDAGDAYRRERYLKTGRGKRYLQKRLATWLAEAIREKLERH